MCFPDQRREGGRDLVRDVSVISSAMTRTDVRDLASSASRQRHRCSASPVLRRREESDSCTFERGKRAGEFSERERVNDREKRGERELN